MKAPKGIKKIIFFYSSLEVDEYIRNNKNRTQAIDKELFIAMTPSVYSYLKQKDFEAQNTLNYFTNDSHKKLLEKSESLINWFRKKVDFVDLGIDVHKAYAISFINLMRLTVHYCLRTIEIILNAVDAHKPEAISASCGKKIVSSVYIEPKEKYLGYIVSAIAKEKNLKFENISRTSCAQGSFSPILANHIFSTIAFVLRYGKFWVWKKIILGKNIFRAKHPIIFTTRRGTDKLIEELRDEGINAPFYFLGGPIITFSYITNFFTKFFGNKYSRKISIQKEKFVDLENKILEEDKLFSYRDIRFGEIVCQKLKNNIIYFILGQFLWTIKVNIFFNTLKPSIVISTGNRIDDIVLAELCRHNNIPSILISHGSHVRPKNKYENIEWGEHGKSLLRAPFSFVALQSPLAEGYLNVFPSTGNVIKTKPLIWGRPISEEKSKTLFRKMFNKRYAFEKTKIVLHAGTPKPDAFRLYVYETPDEYVQAICELANAIEKIPNVVLIVRFRPRKGIGIDDLKYLISFSEKVILSVDESFYDVLGMSNLLVSFSSTTIEEALQNRIPVLLYGGRGRYQHIPAFEIMQDRPVEKSAVYHAKEAKDLEYAIKHILDLNLDRNKNEYLFKPYIYAEHSRTSIDSLLRANLKNKNHLNG